jgi:hypothetical protein
MLKRLGLPALALVAILLLTAPAPANAAVRFGFGVGVAPVYPAYPYAYSYPYAYPYSYAYPYAYPYYYPGYAYPYGYWGGYYGYGWGGGRGWGRGYYGRDFRGGGRAWGGARGLGGGGKRSWFSNDARGLWPGLGSLLRKRIAVDRSVRARQVCQLPAAVYGLRWVSTSGSSQGLGQRDFSLLIGPLAHGGKTVCRPLSENFIQVAGRAV